MFDINQQRIYLSVLQHLLASEKRSIAEPLNSADDQLVVAGNPSQQLAVRFKRTRPGHIGLQQIIFNRTQDLTDLQSAFRSTNGLARHERT